MAINPQLLMQLAPLLMQAIKSTGGIQNVPNIENALQNNYDTGIMNNLFQNLYQKRALDGIDRYTGIDALSDLNNQYSPRTLIPTESASSAAAIFKNMFDADEKASAIANKSMNEISHQEWLNDSANDDFLDMLWKRNNGGPMYKDSNTYVYSKE